MTRRSFRVFLGGALLATAPLFAGFASTESYLAAVGRVAGKDGAEFYTTVWATNLTTAPQTLTFQFLKSGQANPSPASFQDTLQPGETKVYENVVETKLGLNDALGAARITSTGEIFVAERIYNQAPGDDLGNTEGLFFAGVPKSFSISAGQSASIQGLDQGGSENFRYNFALIETSGQPATVNVQVFDGSGAMLGQKAYPLLPYEQIQPAVDDVVPGIATTNARLSATVTGGTGSVILAGAQVANESQDSSGFEMTFRDSLLGTSGGTEGVTSLNGLTGALTLIPGDGISITPSGSSITIAYTGGGGIGLTAITHNATLAGSGTGASPLGVSIPLTLAGSVGGNLLSVTNTNEAVYAQAGGASHIGLGDYGTVIGVIGTSAHGYGVIGATDDAVGVVGVSMSGTGIGGNSNTGVGVAGGTGSGIAVRGESSSGIAISGTSSTGSGVTGSSSNAAGVVGKTRSLGSDAGVEGIAGAPSFGPTGGSGVWGGSDFGAGVAGRSGTSTGVEGSSSSDGYGVLGLSETGDGVHGLVSNSASGVAGINNGSNFGVYGQGNTGTGVYGTSTSGYAIYAQGDMHVNGALSKSSGSFKIDHPLEPESKYLYHSFVESPDMMNVYNGEATLSPSGTAEITLPDWFEALNSDFRYQLTAIGTPQPGLFISMKVAGNRFRIAGGVPGAEVSWMVTGIRHDRWAMAHRVPVEETKPDGENGFYLHPELYGQPASRSLDPAVRRRAADKEKE